MVDIKFTDAAKNFKGESHQIDALEYLQKNTPIAVQEEFQKRFRNKSTAKPTTKTQLPIPGVALIKEFEGCILKAYYDPLTHGLPITIGWGSTRRRDGSRFMIGNTITQQEADDLLSYQLEKDYLPSLEKIPHWNEMNDEMKGALLSFAYNLGAGFYGASGFSTITRHLRDRNWKGLPDALMLYVNPGTNVEAGLRRRRSAEGKLWMTGLNKI